LYLFLFLLFQKQSVMMTYLRFQMTVSLVLLPWEFPLSVLPLSASPLLASPVVVIPLVEVLVVEVVLPVEEAVALLDSLGLLDCSHSLDLLLTSHNCSDFLPIDQK
jgi:hypothetical protein